MTFWILYNAYGGQSVHTNTVWKNKNPDMTGWKNKNAHITVRQNNSLILVILPIWSYMVTVLSQCKKSTPEKLLPIWKNCEATEYKMTYEKIKFINMTYDRMHLKDCMNKSDMTE